MKKSLWAFGTREVVFAAIGAALYGGLSYLTNFLQIPGSANVASDRRWPSQCFLASPLDPLLDLSPGP